MSHHQLTVVTWSRRNYCMLQHRYQSGHPLHIQISVSLADTQLWATRQTHEYRRRYHRHYRRRCRCICCHHHYFILGSMCINRWWSWKRQFKWSSVTETVGEATRGPLVPPYSGTLATPHRWLYETIERVNLESEERDKLNRMWIWF